MSTSAECRKYAQQCVELAHTATTQRHRTLLLEIAAKWLQLADDATHRPPAGKRASEDESDVRQ